MVIPYLTSPNATLVNTMLDRALAKIQTHIHPIIHSDRGAHYRWPGWIMRVENANLTRSMSKKVVHRTMQPVRDSVDG